LHTQAGAPAATSIACTSLKLERGSEQQGPNIINGAVGLIATPTGCGWTAASNQAWLSITQGASGKGSGSINYQVIANATSEERKGVLTITGAAGIATTITVVQAGTATLNIPAEAGSGDGGGDGSSGAGEGSGGGGEAPGGRQPRETDEQ
jgi:hypothetical protein